MSSNADADATANETPLDTFWGDFEEIPVVELIKILTGYLKVDLTILPADYEILFKALFLIIFQKDLCTKSDLKKLINLFGPFDEYFIRRACSIMQTPYFHGEMTSEVAEEILKTQRHGTYLFRLSSTHADTFSFSFIYNGEVRHTRIYNDFEKCEYYCRRGKEKIRRYFTSFDNFIIQFEFIEDFYLSRDPQILTNCYQEVVEDKKHPLYELALKKLEMYAELMEFYLRKIMEGDNQYQVKLDQMYYARPDFRYFEKYVRDTISLKLHLEFMPDGTGAIKAADHFSSLL